MKLTTKQDIEAPLDFVYAQMTDFEQFERMVMRRGAEVERTDRLTRTGPGMAWRLKFAFRGKERKLIIRLVDIAHEACLDYGLDSPMFEGGARIDFLALAPKRTRMTITSEVRAKTLSARLLLQSAKLARRRFQNRFDSASAGLATLIQDRWRASVAR